MSEKQKSGLEKLVAQSPGMEIWWDASPLVFQDWADSFIAAQTPAVREWLEPQVRRLYVEDDPAQSLFRGVTTNPVITKAGIDTLPDTWYPWIEGEIGRHPNFNAAQITWRTYKEFSRLGAELYRPIFEESGYRHGFVSAQVDPRELNDAREIMEQALGLKALSPNIMIKVPGTRAGILSIFLLTTLGVPTNATLVFTLPQILAVAEAVKGGREVGECHGTDYSQWRSVITLMMARFEEREEVAQQAQEAGFELTEELMRWSGIAIMKKAYHLLREREYPSKLLLASSRVGPEEGQILHVEETAGANLVYTMNQSFIENVLLSYADKDFEPRIDKPIPAEALEKLLTLPYFRQGYEENGLQPEEFLHHPGTVFTGNQFSKAMDAFEAFVADKMRG